LLKIVSVNLNYQIGVHMNFAQSRIPSVAYNQNTVATRRVAMGDNGAMPPPTPKFSG